ncbi:MAG: VWA domain-containing protein [Peptoniphilus sp.]|nr:VWA domain-containing protein [Peptoniphilus sp.]
MKKVKAVSLFLSIALIFSIVISDTMVPTTYAFGTRADESGMVLDKTATENDDGTYTIKLEAYAKGDKVTIEKEKNIPADIVLVLDQSGSMEDYMSYRFERYIGKTNEEYYALRHNGDGAQNLYYPLGNGSYAPVSVSKEDINVYYEYPSNYTNYDYASYANNIYRWNGAEYLKVALTWVQSGYDYWYTYSTDGWWYRQYGTYSYPEDFNGWGPMYYHSYTYSQYTYSYVDNDGYYRTIGVSDGEAFQPQYALYEMKPASTTVRLDALKNAVGSFIDNIRTKSAGEDGQFGTDDDVNHRVAVVGFATGEYSYDTTNYPLYENTELFIGGTQHNYNDYAYYYYGSALQNMNTLDGYNNVVASKNALSAKGATYPNYGLEMARGILDANPVESGERNRVVVLFTDGAPGYSSYENDVAASALRESTHLKNAGTTVYSVGIFDGADASADGIAVGASNRLENEFMQYVSSNDGVPSDPGYYLSASDSTTLNNIFESISEQIEEGGSSTTLDDNAVIRDIITPYFELPPEGTPGAGITLETYSYVGENMWEKNNGSMGTSAIIDGVQRRRVSVTGFNFSENWCGKEVNGSAVTYRGNKLVISFKVNVKPEFLGGNGVPTNTRAGVFESRTSTTPIFPFPEPVVDVPIPDINVNAPDYHKYLLQDISLETLREGLIKVGNVNIDLNKQNQNYGLEFWKNAYVNISVEIKDKEGNLITEDFNSLKEDDEYTVSVEVTPKKSGSYNKKNGEGTGQIYVYKPKLTFDDGEIWYGGSVPGYTDLMERFIDGETKWLNGEILANSTTANSEMGTAPELTLSFTTSPLYWEVITDKINTKEDVPVDVTVALGATDISEHTEFVHVKCEGKDCTPPEGFEFLLHNNTCQLTLTKKGGASDEPYVFTLKRDGAPYSEVTIVGNNNKTIYELPVGKYSVAEDENWSWRYEEGYGLVNGVALSANAPSGSITCTNSKTEPYWLNGFSSVEENMCDKTTP